MSRRTCGMLFILISAFLYGSYYLSAAVFGSNVVTWNSQLFNAMLESIGDGPKNLSKVALYVGVAFLVWAEIEEYYKNRKKLKP